MYWFYKLKAEYRAARLEMESEFDDWGDLAESGGQFRA